MKRNKKIVVLPAIGFIAMLLMAALAITVKPSVYPNPTEAKADIVLTTPAKPNALAPASCRPAAACRDEMELVLATTFTSDGVNGNDQLALAPRPDGGYLGNSNVAITFETDGGYLGNDTVLSQGVEPNPTTVKYASATTSSAG